MSITTFIILIFIGVMAGFLSGVVGVGGGLIIIPLLIIMIGLDQHQAQGTSIAVLLPPVGILAALNYHKLGFVKWEYALVIAITFIVGGYYGSKYAVSLKPEVIRKVFAIVMIIGGLKMIFHDK